MSWAIASIISSILISLIAGIFDASKHLVKGALIFFALLSAIGGVASKLSEDNELIATRKEQKSAQESLKQARQELANLNKVIALIDLTVGDLAKLNDLSGGRKYYVRIATGKTRKELEEPFLKNIEGQFKGAHSSDLVTIRDPRPGSSNFELVFGQHLDLAAAEVFHRLAMSHHFPPEGDVAAIRPEPEQPTVNPSNPVTNK